MPRRIIAFTAASLLSLPALAATPLQDNGNIFTAQVENDAVSTLRGTSDQYYTAGQRAGWTGGTNEVPRFLQNAANAVWGNGVQRLSLDISQSLFTPRNTQTPNPSLTDRPYAGVLGLTASVIHNTGDAQTVLALFGGTVGPDAGGKTIQNGFHKIIGDTPNQGWNTQIKNEPVFDIFFERTWRVPLGSYQSVSFDVLPSATAGFGLLRNYLQAGAVFRLGQGLDSDYGVARIRPGLTGTDAFTATRPFAWYVFAGADGQAVGTDVTLTGNNFATSRHVAGKWDVGEFEGGAAVIYHGVRVTYSQTWQTQEFRTQKAGLFSFGSLAASVRF